MRLRFPQDQYRGEVPCTEAQLATIFKDHDTNGDGKLSRSELDLAFRKLGSRWPWFRSVDGFVMLTRMVMDLSISKRS
ncbi:hypothetical protein I3842_15G058300 [Carya illinoinensis]|uniref:EF-hand domain-containing protein n=1 Tax=Carya illinoinensis TaxID=32201 RepID=A0A922DAK1_CARIL|nr:hypothetical protein I3842_15G058300 [Carya illinoinensis]